MTRIRRLATAPTSQIPDAILRTLIASLNDDAQTLLEISTALRPQAKTMGNWNLLSRLNYVIGHLEGKAEGLRYYLSENRN